MAGYRAIESAGGAQWNSKLLKELSFIKQKLRYPYGSVVLGSIVFIILALLALTVKLMTMAVDFRPVLVIVAGVGVFLLFPALQYFTALRFRVINTPFTKDDNTALLNEFLIAQGLVVFRHPEADEIFQIHSKQVTYRNGYSQEFMTFIADDRRILVNTYYSDYRIGHSRPAHELAARLKQWMNGGNRGNNSYLQ